MEERDNFDFKTFDELVGEIPSRSNLEPGIEKLKKDKEISVKFIVGIFKDRYNIFKRRNIDFINLYKGDFRPMNNLNPALSRAGLQIVLPSPVFMTVDYGKLLPKFLDVFLEDRMDSDFATWKMSVEPREKTVNLENFKKRYPGENVDAELMAFELEPEEDRRRMIIRKRLFNPHTRELLSEIWDAVMLRPDDSQVQKSGFRVRPRSHAAVVNERKTV